MGVGSKPNVLHHEHSRALFLYHNPIGMYRALTRHTENLAETSYLCYFYNMPGIRAFIAIEVPFTIQSQLDKISKEMQGLMKTDAIRWVPGRNIHLTLKFLGEVSLPNVEHLKHILTVAGSKIRPFEIQVGGLGAFPSLHRPRVLWIGLESPPSLYQLQKNIESETIRLGYPAEERGFSPHLTLARISHDATSEDVREIGLVLSKFHPHDPGAFKVQNIHLFESDLRPGGAVYTPLFTSSIL
jgi:RNA 2',3'-cyclic 3'-phosphodiesterase